MKTIRTKIYQFSELCKDAQQKAIEWYRGIEDFQFAWEDLKMDAREIGLKIFELNNHYANKGEFTRIASEVAQAILNNHGEKCETYKTATQFITDCKEIEASLPELWDEEIEEDANKYDREFQIEEKEQAFLESLLEDYRIMYNNDIDSYNSDKYITDTIEANNYEFHKDGRRY